MTAENLFGMYSSNRQLDMTSNVAMLGSYRGFAPDKTAAVQVYSKCEGGALVEFI